MGGHWRLLRRWRRTRATCRSAQCSVMNLPTAWPRERRRKIMSSSDDASHLDHDALADSALDAVTGRDIEIADDELKQVTGGALKLPGLHKASDVTLKRGAI